MTTNIDYAPWPERLRHKLEWDIGRLILAQQLAKNWIESRRMGKGLSLADRIKAATQTHVKECDAIAAEMDEVEKLQPDAYAAGHSQTANLKSDIAGMLGELRQLTNLPLENGKLS